MEEQRDIEKMNTTKNIEMSMDDAPNRGFMHPKKFGVYLFAVTITMAFAALSSALIVRKAEGNWLQFGLPPQMLWSTITIIVSSATLFLAQYAVKRDMISRVKLGMSLTTALGFLFCAFQVLAAINLIDNQIFWTGPTSNPAGSFVYVLAGLHIFHVFIGIVYLLIILIRSLRNEFNSTNTLGIEMCAVFWHFLGALWVYLYLFLYFNH